MRIVVWRIGNYNIVGYVMASYKRQSITTHNYNVAELKLLAVIPYKIAIARAYVNRSNFFATSRCKFVSNATAATK